MDILQTLSGDMLTVSLGGWMELPNLSMEEWRNSMECRRDKLPSLCRTSVETIAQYYSSYVEIIGMASNSGTILWSPQSRRLVLTIFQTIQ